MLVAAADDDDADDDDDGVRDRRPKYSSSEVCKAVVGKGKEIFRLPPLQRPMAWLKGVLRPRYSSKSMEGVLKEYLKDRTLKNTVKPLLVPCYDLGNARPFVFSNSAAMKSESLDFPLVGICRATSAVPGLFKPSILSSTDGRTRVLAIDGGLVMNNPAAAAITHVLHNPAEFPWVSSMADILLLSLGTGLFHRPYPLHSSRHVLRWGALQWAKPVARIVLDGLSDMVDHFLSIAFHGQHRSNYLRIQVPLPPPKHRFLSRNRNSFGYCNKIARICKTVDFADPLIVTSLIIMVVPFVTPFHCSIHCHGTSGSSSVLRSCDFSFLENLSSLEAYPMHYFFRVSACVLLYIR
jgi:hypothetical protein